MIAAIFFVIALSTPIFKEGTEVLGTRFEEGGGAKEGLLDRIVGDFQNAFKDIGKKPVLGYGSGTGTNVGSQLRVGQRGMTGSGGLMVENEWQRCLSEGGLFLGLLYIFLRCLIALFLFVESFKSLRKSNMLPMLLFGACATNVLIGQFGQPNILGFAVFVAGLCLAATNVEVKAQAGVQ